MERSDSRPSLPSHFVAFARRLPPRAPVFVAPHKPDAGLGPGVIRVRPPPEPVVIEAETVGRPKFLGNPECPFALFSRRRQDGGHQTATVPPRGPWYVN